MEILDLSPYRAGNSKRVIGWAPLPSSPGYPHAPAGRTTYGYSSNEIFVPLVSWTLPMPHCRHGWEGSIIVSSRAFLVMSRQAECLQRDPRALLHCQFRNRKLVIENYKHSPCMSEIHRRGATNSNRAGLERLVVSQLAVIPDSHSSSSVLLGGPQLKRCLFWPASPGALAHIFAKQL